MGLIRAEFSVGSGFYITCTDGSYATAGIQKLSPAFYTGRHQSSTDHTLP